MMVEVCSSCIVNPASQEVLSTLCPLIFAIVDFLSFQQWWAHCRPHSSGHQLHFDSDNEGQGTVRNPIISTVLYLSENEVRSPEMTLAVIHTKSHCLVQLIAVWDFVLISSRDCCALNYFTNVQSDVRCQQMCTSPVI